MEKSKEVPSGKLSRTPTPLELKNETVGGLYQTVQTFAVSHEPRRGLWKLTIRRGKKEEIDTIVRAVNAHDELVKALKQARESYVYRTRHENKMVGEGDTLLSVIDAALAKAKGR